MNQSDYTGSSRLLDLQELRALAVRGYPTDPGAGLRPWIGIMLAGSPGASSEPGDPDGSNMGAFDRAMTYNGFHYGQAGDTSAQNCTVFALASDPFPWPRTAAGPDATPPPSPGCGDAARTMVNFNPDIIIVTGSQLGRAVKYERGSYKKTMPIVMATDDGDCVAAGLVDNPAAPTKNVTGVTSNFSALAGERLRRLVSHHGKGQTEPVGILWNPDVYDKNTDWASIEAAAAAIPVNLVNHQANALGQVNQLGTDGKIIKAAVRDLKDAGAKGIMTLGDALTFRGRHYIIDEVNNAPPRGCVIFECSRELGDRAGGVGGRHHEHGSYGPHMQSLYAGAAHYCNLYWNWATKSLRAIQPPVLLLGADEIWID